jgi:hypothetical protein
VIYKVRKWVCDFVGIYVCLGLLTYNMLVFWPHSMFGQNHLSVKML